MSENEARKLRMLIEAAQAALHALAHATREIGEMGFSISEDLLHLEVEELMHYLEEDRKESKRWDTNTKLSKRSITANAAQSSRERRANGPPTKTPPPLPLP